MISIFFYLKQIRKYISVKLGGNIIYVEERENVLFKQIVTCLLELKYTVFQEEDTSVL